MSSAFHITVTGRVQGVGFRWACRHEARALGLAGWVRNGSDGSVEIHAEGAAGALDKLLAWCREGPPGALVKSVSSSATLPSGATAFDVRV